MKIQSLYIESLLRNRYDKCIRNDCCYKGVIAGLSEEEKSEGYGFLWI